MHNFFFRSLFTHNTISAGRLHFHHEIPAVCPVGDEHKVGIELLRLLIEVEDGVELERYRHLQQKQRISAQQRASPGRLECIETEIHFVITTVTQIQGVLLGTEGQTLQYKNRKDKSCFRIQQHE